MTIQTSRPAVGLPVAETVTARLDEGFTLPAEFYVDPGIHSLEQEVVFERSWQYAGHLSRVERPGDHIVTQVGRIPVLVTRTKNGDLRGFVNACRHRLHPLATESGHCKLLQCSYHGWTYELDGRLRAAPRSQREESFDVESIALAPVAVDTWDQWLFVNGDAGAAPLSDSTREIAPLAARLNGRLAGYEHRDTFEYAMDCNWKVWAENLIECYHCPTLHKGSFGKSYNAQPEHYEIKAWRDTIWQSAPIKWVPRDVDPATTEGFEFAFLWPTSFVGVDDYVGFAGNVRPTGPESCAASADMYVRPGVDEELLADWLDMWDRTFREDKQATDLQQAGYRSGGVPYGRLMLDSEECLMAFMRRTWEAVRGKAGAC
jgi:phenylpropionate dioxygenase-like ring-hydroxylating dioxygenase large terminal subunit